MPLSLAMSAALALSLTSGPGFATDLPMFERAELDQDVSLVTYGVLEDTRCRDPELCFREERLVLAAVVTSDGAYREAIALELGVPVFVAGGWLTLTGTTAPPRDNGAIPLSEYALDFVFERDAETSF